MGEAASRNRAEPCLLRLVSTTAAVPGRLRLRGLGREPLAELWYVFDHLDQSPWNWTAADRKLTEEMSNYWVNFARSKRPGPSVVAGVR